jgi:integrase
MGTTERRWKVTIKKDTIRGTYFFVVDLPPVGGRRQQLRRRGFPTKKAALAEERRVMATVQDGRYVRPARGTVGDYLTETWLPTKRRAIRETTALGYEKVIRTRIVPLIGNVQLTALDAVTLESLYAQLLTDGGKGGRPLSPKTVANAAGVLSIALGDAVRLKLLPYNVASDAKLPRRKRREMTAWTESEASVFLVSVSDDRLFPLWRLALATGMRRGELCGLRWSDVDAKEGAITIASTRVVADRVIVGEPKTAAGSRVLALDAETMRALQAWRRTQVEERLAAGEAWENQGLVFVDELGRPPHPESMTRWWRDAVARAGVPAIRLHDARHTAATVLLRAGVPVKVVSQRLGHADVAVTMRIYQHVTAQDDQAAADALARAFAGES